MVNHHHCKANDTRWVSILHTEERGWEIEIHCNDDMDNIHFKANWCPFCGEALKQTIRYTLK